MELGASGSKNTVDSAKKFTWFARLLGRVLFSTTMTVRHSTKEIGGL